MNPAEIPLAALTLVRAAAVRPTRTQSLAHWREEALAAYACADAAPYRGLTEMLFAQTGHDGRALCEQIGLPAETRFREASGQTQGDLARQALAALVDSLADAAVLARCKLAVYAAASVDEHFFQSTIARLAGSFGFSSLPHFSLAQLQGASLPAAAELIAAMLRDEGDAALFVSAEKWPTPFPRALDVPAVLADGAAALWFERGDAAGLRYAGGSQRSFDPFVTERLQHGRRTPGIAMPALLEAAAAVIAQCLAEQGLSPRDVAGWIPSGMDARADAALRERLGIEAELVAAPRADDGYLCAAAAGTLLADLLARVGAGDFADGELWLSWGASFGGGIGVALWRVAHSRDSA